MIKTSKVKAVNLVKEWQNSFGVTYYCQCEMDNGDKIEIGKAKPVQQGWELTYKIVGDESQQQWVKAKSEMKQEVNNKNSTSQVITNNQFKADPIKQKSIELQCCLKEAINFHNLNGFLPGSSQLDQVCDTAQYFYDKLLK